MVGGLGAGGQVIYALNITDPVDFTEANAAYSSSNMNGIIVGEWTPSNLTCTNVTCNTNLGNTFGTPEIRRFHNGQWGAIIGNGIGSQAGTAGIYIMLIGNTGTNAGVPTFLYLASGSTVKNNGIVEAASADLDNDHIVDYIYAGDLQGNLWRFDVTSPNTANWGQAYRVFTTPGGASQPITTRVTVGTLQTIATTTTAAGAVLSTGSERVMINFGTGQMTPPTVLNGAVYATGQQYLFGVWDWNMGTAGVTGSGWNALNPTINALSLTATPPAAANISNNTMVAQTITQETPTVTTTTVTNGVTTTSTTTGIRKVSSNPICFIGDTSCSGGTNLGWFLALPDSAGSGSNEQVIFDPALSPDGEFTVNTFVPAVNSALSCTVSNPTGWSMGLNPVSGASSATPYFSVGGQAVDGIQLNGTGTPSFVYSGQAGDHNAEYFITQASANGAVVQPTRVNSTTIVTGQRLNWIQRR
jgi:type IV pilus assembly protein PilY1